MPKSFDVVQESTGFKVYAGTMAVLTVVAAGYLALTDGLPPLAATALLCALVVYTEHRSIEFSKGAAVNAGFIVLTASVVAFHTTSGMLLGPLLVGMAKGIYFPHLSARAVWMICWNAASGGLAMLLTALVFAALPISTASPLPLEIAAAVCVALTCALGLCLFLAPGFVFRGQTFRSVCTNFAPHIVESIPFSVLGFFLGQLYLSIGLAAVLMLIVPMFIAREMFASYVKVKEAHDETVKMLIYALEQKDRYTSGHSERVATYAEYMGKELNLGPSRMERLRFAALMHDIGKLVVPNHLLNKPGRLTEAEYARIRIHEKVSVQMLAHIDFLRPVAAATDSAHARFDPDAMDHPIEPYIVMIADAYDAMTSTRAYRKALSQEVAFKELRDKAGLQFHPECVDALIRAIEARGEKHGAGYEIQPQFDNAPDAGLGSAGLGDLLPTEA